MSIEDRMRAALGGRNFGKATQSAPTTSTSATPKTPAGRSASIWRTSSMGGC